MEHRQYIRFLNAIEKLKCRTRHSWTSSGRHESVAEHSWRLAVMAMLCRDEYPALDIDRVIRMCLVHDLGEAVTGDIPAFNKTAADEGRESDAVSGLLSLLPQDYARELGSLFEEMYARQTPEARLFKALDNMEALVSHNEAPLATWLPLEYSENLTYGQENVEWSLWTLELKEAVKADALAKMEKGE